jgi:glycosyltransferase involved in cell wall biosynthesis
MSSDSLEVALVTPWDTGGGIANYSERLRAALEDASAEVTVVPIRHPRTWNLAKFNEILRSIPSSVDIVHVQYEAGVFGEFGMTGICTPTFYLELARKKWPVVTTIHEVHREYPGHSSITGRFVGIRDRLLERIILTGSHTTVVHTAEAASILHERYGTQSSVEQMRHPVDATVSTPVAKDVARKELDINTGSVFVTFGWVESKKRYSEVVNCLPDVPNAVYLIAGEPRHEGDEEVLNRVFDAATELGVRDRVRHVGYVQDTELPTLFGAADAAIAPYKQVTQSGAVNTALAYDCPVVARSLPAFEELANEYDCILTYEDQIELSSTLCDLSERDLSDLQGSAKHYSNTETWEAFGKTTKNLYERVIDGNAT